MINTCLWSKGLLSNLLTRNTRREGGVATLTPLPTLASLANVTLSQPYALLPWDPIHVEAQEVIYDWLVVTICSNLLVKLLDMCTLLPTAAFALIA